MDRLELLIRRECDIADELAVIVIQCDELVHTNERPFCGDHYCPCHYDFTDEGNAEYHALIEQPIDDGLFTEAEAERFLYGKQL